MVWVLLMVWGLVFFAKLREQKTRAGGPLFRLVWRTCRQSYLQRIGLDKVDVGDIHCKGWAVRSGAVCGLGLVAGSRLSCDFWGHSTIVYEDELAVTASGSGLRREASFVKDGA